MSSLYKVPNIDPSDISVNLRKGTTLTGREFCNPKHGQTPETTTSIHDFRSSLETSKSNALPDSSVLVVHTG